MVVVELFLDTIDKLRIKNGPEGIIIQFDNHKLIVNSSSVISIVGHATSVSSWAKLYISQSPSIQILEDKGLLEVYRIVNKELGSKKLMFLVRFSEVRKLSIYERGKLSGYEFKFK